ncbi:unnamed protein product [Ilex paraguariensis]|uniref:Nudix hydrolase domain-containing protein n=1 Tax=Ilex paraguariensis TaxID=185542 RepID=A0ABC8S7P2_9AQUA
MDDGVNIASTLLSRSHHGECDIVMSFILVPSILHPLPKVLVYHVICNIIPIILDIGGWEGDETVEEAAAREATEEAGVRGVLMGFLGYYHFKSKTRQDECSPEGVCKAAMFSLLVKEELESWPEQNTRRRNWLAIPKAVECCRHPWMRDALVEGFSKWHDEKIDRGKEFSDQD